MSRESLVEAYITALPFAAIAIIAVPGGGCRVETGAPGEIRYFFKPSHLDLVLGAAGLGTDPIDEAPAAVAELIERTAAAIGAPFNTAAEIRAAAAVEVEKVTARVEAMRQAGGLKQVNAEYKAYRQAQVAKAEKATPYAVFLARFTAGLVRDVATMGRAI
ncbi:hypothetical protein [Bradyrhizobium genosp. P]|uniref:hypothetical protein n=1 Tax=Bradyrhizobium genosp. P TaxID=83641 RepID=UPI003CE9D78C